MGLLDSIIGAATGGGQGAGAQAGLGGLGGVGGSSGSGHYTCHATGAEAGP